MKPSTNPSKLPSRTELRLSKRAGKKTCCSWDRHCQVKRKEFSPRPGLVKLLALSNFPAFVHCDPCFTGLYGQCCLSLSDTLCHRCFLLLDRMRLLSPVSRTQWLLCADPPFFCAPLMTWLRNGSLVSDALFLGGLICFRICLINSFHCFGQWTWMNVSVFVSFHERELSFSRCCSWLKGEPPGTSTLAAGSQKKKCQVKRKERRCLFVFPLGRGKIPLGRSFWKWSHFLCFLVFPHFFGKVLPPQKTISIPKRTWTTKLKMFWKKYPAGN